MHYIKKCKILQRQKGEKMVEKIKELCTQNKTTILKMEKELGFPKGSVYKWDKNDPSVSKAKKVADFLKVKIDDLI